MRPNRSALPVLAIIALALAGCNVWQNRAEFAPPQSRWPDSQPSPVAADAPPPAQRAVHCYRTLAAVDCFAEKQPARGTGFSGAYPENPLN